MKKWYCLTAILLLLLCVTSCSSRKTPAHDIELVVFAASSMKDTLEQIELLYKEASPKVKLTFNFDSVGTLKTRIQEGAECDIFISAAQRQMDQLDITANPRLNVANLDFVLQGTRFDFLENKVTLCVPEGNPAKIQSFEDWAEKFSNGDILLAMGNSEVAVGQYTRRIFSFFKIDEDAMAASGNITYGSNLQEVTTKIREPGVSCGIIYCTDAYGAGLEIIDYATVDMCGQIIYPAAVMKPSKNPEAAKAFMDYLKTDKALAVFEKAGFTAAWE